MWLQNFISNLLASYFAFHLYTKCNIYKNSLIECFLYYKPSECLFMDSFYNGGAVMWWLSLLHNLTQVLIRFKSHSRHLNDSENLWQWSKMEIRLETYRRRQRYESFNNIHKCNFPELRNQQHHWKFVFKCYH